MARLYLRTKDKSYPDGDWELILGKGRVRLTDSEGYTEADFPREEASRRFQLPSFWASFKKIGIVDDEGKQIIFEPDAECIAEIQRYLDFALAAEGEQAISSTKGTGWAMIIGGTALLSLGIGLFVFFIFAFNQPDTNRRVRYTVPIMVIIGGGALIGGGVNSLRRAGRAKRDWGTEED